MSKWPFPLTKCDLRAGGFAIGFACGFVTKWLLSLLRSRRAKAPEEMALTVAMAYLAFYLANAPGRQNLVQKL